MKQKIKEALQQEYKNLGLNDEAFEGVAAFGETLGINEETLANFVKGAKDLLKREQSNADKVRNAKSESAKQVEELKAKLAELEAQKNDKGEGEGNKPNLEQMFEDVLSRVVKPLQEESASLKAELASMKATRSAEDAFKVAKENFFGNEYAKKYTSERDDAWERAVEVNDLTGKKMTAEELQTKAMGYFNTLVSRKGVDTSKPFESEGNGNKEPNFEGHKRILQAQGLLPKDEN